MVFLLFAQSIWFIAAAYVANAFPTVVKGKMPIDFGRTWNGKRIFGDSKTIEGTAAGIAFGAFIGFLQVGLQPRMPPELGLPVLTLPVVLMLCLGTMVGDILGSFVKRRLGLKSGDPAFFLDQLGFLIFAFIFARFLTSIDISIMVFLLLLTPFAHILTNIFGYLLKLKKHPW